MSEPDVRVVVLNSFLERYAGAGARLGYCVSTYLPTVELIRPGDDNCIEVVELRCGAEGMEVWLYRYGGGTVKHAGGGKLPYLSREAAAEFALFGGPEVAGLYADPGLFGLVDEFLRGWLTRRLGSMAPARSGRPG